MLIEPVNDIWKDRPKSNFVQFLKRASKMTVTEMADAIFCSVPTFNCKLNRNTFTVEDLILIANRCGFSIFINNGEGKDICEVRTKFYKEGT